MSERARERDAPRRRADTRSAKAGRSARSQIASWRSDRSACFDEEGQVGGVEALIFGVLVFVLGSLAIANAWGVLDAKVAVIDAAREAARAYVQTPAGSDPYAAARQAAGDSLAASGRDVSRMQLSISGSLARCARVAAQVSYRVPLVSVPLIGGIGNGIVASATRSELVDPFRNGLPGEGDCD